jgi:hypothetical protein
MLATNCDMQKIENPDRHFLDRMPDRVRSQARRRRNVAFRSAKVALMACFRAAKGDDGES